MSRSKTSMNNFEVRQAIKALNRLDLDNASYSSIRERINQMIQDVGLFCFIINPGTLLYRARKSEKKLTNISEIGSPPAKNITNYQRCNQPREPMFYCGVHPVTAIYEIEPDIGDIIYLGNWTTTNRFLVQTIPLDEKEGMPDDRRRDVISTFFETKFSQPIHETFSSQYKITSAISDILTCGNIDGSIDDELQKNKIGAIKYPSVARTGFAECLALRPWLEANCIKLNYIEEMIVTDIGDRVIHVDRKDFSNKFEDGQICWAGRRLHWNLTRPGLFKATVEQGSWVMRHEDGTVIQPG